MCSSCPRLSLVGLIARGCFDVFIFCLLVFVCLFVLVSQSKLESSCRYIRPNWLNTLQLTWTGCNMVSNKNVSCDCYFVQEELSTVPEPEQQTVKSTQYLRQNDDVGIKMTVSNTV